MLKLADRLERLVVSSGRIGAWLTLFMVIVTVVVVVLRYFFDFGRIWMQELVTWSHAAVFLLAAGYTLSRDEHVRVDVFYRRARPQVRAWIDIAGTLLLLYPVCLLLFVTGSRYALKAWHVSERSPETGGLPFPFVPLAKTLLPAMLLLLMLQGLVILLRRWHALRSGEFPGERNGGDVL